MISFRSTVLSSALFLLLFCITYSESAMYMLNLTDGTLLKEDPLFDEEVQPFAGKQSIKLNTKNCRRSRQLFPNMTYWISPTFQRYYQFGSKRYEDMQLGFDQQYYTYDTPQWLQIVLQYPKNGKSGPAALTYLYLSVESENTLGNAFITEGGLGQPLIGVSIFVYNTRVFSWSASVYGQ